eukprot:55985-Amphidinium_carterae.2
MTCHHRWKPVERIGEAVHPGPMVCSCNPGVLLQARIAGAARKATELGVFSSSIRAGARNAWQTQTVTQWSPGSVLQAGYGTLNQKSCATVQRPVSDERASPVLRGVDDGEMGKIDCFLVSKAMMPASGREEATDFKPDHRAIRLGLGSGEDLTRFSWPARLRTETDGIINHCQPLLGSEGEACWSMDPCSAAEHALGLPVDSRGSLLLARRRQVLPVPDKEIVEAAKQQATVTNLKRRLVETGSVSFFDWLAWLGPHPPTAAAQNKAL